MSTELSIAALTLGVTILGMIITAVWIVAKINSTAELLTILLNKLEIWVGDIDTKTDLNKDHIASHAEKINSITDTVKRIERRIEHGRHTDKG